MPLNIITPPATEPVGLNYAKTFLRIDTDAEDSLIGDMIVSARLRVEALTGHALISRRVVQTYPENAPNTLVLPLQPSAIVHEVRVVTRSQERVVVPQAAYTVNARAHPAKLFLQPQTHWHQFAPNVNAIEVEFTAGFGESAEDVPMPFKQAILFLLAQSYEHRGDSANRPVPMMVEALLMPYRWMKL